MFSNRVVRHEGRSLANENRCAFGKKNHVLAEQSDLAGARSCLTFASLNIEYRHSPVSTLPTNRTLDQQNCCLPSENSDVRMLV